MPWCLGLEMLVRYAHSQGHARFAQLCCYLPAILAYVAEAIEPVRNKNEKQQTVVVRIVGRGLLCTVLYVVSPREHCCCYVWLCGKMVENIKYVRASVD